MNVTLTDVMALAPESKRQNKAMDINLQNKWCWLARNQSVIWGEVQSSGKSTYQVFVSRENRLVYKCTCRSTESPCKHVLAMLLQYVEDDSAFQQMPLADWVETRLKKQQKSHRAKPRQVNPKTLKRRQAEVEAGLNELDLWMRDLIRAGLASVQGKPSSFFSNPAKRLVDAKAPVLAERVKGLAKISGSGEVWADQMLEELSQIHLIVQGFRQFDKLSPALQADIRAAVGWHVTQNELVNEPEIKETWLVIGFTQSLQDKLKTQRLWLHGLNTQRRALLLDFAYGSVDFDHQFSMGDIFEGSLIFYPSAYPLRAVVKQWVPSDSQADTLPGYDTFKDAIDAYSAALTKNPWLQQFPVAFCDVTPAKDGRNWYLVDTARNALPLAPAFRSNWELLAVSGGRPLWLFGEWDGASLYPLAVAQDSKFSTL